MFADLADLCSRLAAVPGLRSLEAALQAAPSAGSGAMLQGAPLLAAARSPVVAALATRQTLPLLYLLPNADMAQRAAEDLRQWLQPDQVLLYPANDTMPYEYMAPTASLVGQRLRVLQTLARQTGRALVAPLVIVASIKALVQPTLAPGDLAATLLDLRIDSQFGQDALLRRCVELGYQTVPLVEEPGQVARRGGLVDIWPASEPQPLRVEWFGDEIDSLRLFDSQSQRSEQRLHAATIGPPAELLAGRRAQALERLQQLDTGALRPEVGEDWQHILVQLEMGGQLASGPFLAPLFAEPAGALCSLLDHLPPGALVVASERLLLAQAAADYHDQASDQRTSLIAGGELPPDFPRPYLLWSELCAQARRLVLLDVTNNEAGGGDAAGGGDEDRGGDGARGGDITDYISLTAPTGEPLFAAAPMFGGQLRRLVQDIVGRLRQGETVVIATLQAARLEELVNEERSRTRPGEEPEPSDPAAPPGDLTLLPAALDAGWRLPTANLTLYTDSEIFGWRQRRSLTERHRRKERSAAERAAFLRGLKHGDYVVHIEHGIAVYEGLLRRSVGDVEREYLSLRYASGDRLYVPVDQADRVARYIGTGGNPPQLTRLGTQEWERAKRKARAAVQDMADELLAIYAQRQTNTGHPFLADNQWQRGLEDAFPYIETEDQLRALREIKQDMEAPHPMDRLMCGDVGFGKTEVALRAAFKAVQDNRQVAVLVPTTVLAQQHYTTFSQRMVAFPVTVEMLSRLRSPREQDAILQRLARGEIDIIIGTHRLLSKDVQFRALGLLVVDEEQRFGVRHKERLKQLRAEIDVLTLTATPIPRTLHMTLAGIRDMSLIETPPEDRLPIKTYVLPYSENLVRDAIQRELERGGQVYVVHNRVHSIYHVAARLRTLVPEAEIGVAHGQLDERQLEKAMLDFFGGAYDILVCTTIIENGLDVPNANTLIIDEAPNYGLAQLYQLRGRVGRSSNRAYAYLLYRQERPMTPEAQERLQAIQEANELGAGFRIAMRDLEIRGAGNLLGAEQSGHIAAVGFDLYSQLLEQAVRQLKQRQDAGTTGAQPGAPAPQPVVVNEKVLVSPLVTLDLPLNAYLPDDYITDEAVRLNVYQRMVAAQTPDEVHTLRLELLDRFGEIPQPAADLLTWLHLKALALAGGISSVMATESECTIRLPLGSSQQRDELNRRFAGEPAVKVGPQFIRLDRRALSGDWVEKLIEVLERLGERPHRSARISHRAR